MGVDVLLRRAGQLPAPRDTFYDDVLFLDTIGKEAVLAAGDEGGNDGGVPAGVEDGDAEIGA